MTEKNEDRFPKGSIVFLKERSCNAFASMTKEEVIGVPMIVVGSSSRDYAYVRPADLDHPWYKKYPGTPLELMYQYVRTSTVYKRDAEIDSSIEEAFV